MTPIELSAGAAAVAATASGVSAIITAFQAGLARKAAHEASRNAAVARLDATKARTIDQLNKVLVDTADMEKAISAMDYKSFLACTDTGQMAAMSQVVVDYFQHWEHLAAGTNAEALDVELLSQMTGLRLLGVYKRCAYIIRHRLRQSSRSFDQFQLLLDRLLQIHVSEHRITKAVVRRLRQAHMDKEALRQLRPLLSKQYDNYQKLDNDLCFRGLDSWKHLVLKFSRVSRYVIETYDKSKHRKGALELIETVRGIDPFSFPGDAANTNIAEWLDGMAGEHCYVLVDAVSFRSVVGFVAIQLPSYALTDSPLIDFFGRPQFRDEMQAIDIHRNYAIIRKLAVDPKHCKRKLGQILLRHAIKVIRSLELRNCAVFRVSVDPKHDITTPSTSLPISEKAVKLSEAEGGCLVRTEDRSQRRLMTYVF
jgi:hypothetical protein